MTRPNILLISADQQRADCFGFMGRKVKTPHLDRPAADGAHFTGRSDGGRGVSDQLFQQGPFFDLSHV